MQNNGQNTISLFSKLTFEIVQKTKSAQKYLQPYYGNGVFGNVFSWATLRGKHCRHPIDVMGVVDTFGQFVNNLIQKSSVGPV